MQDSRQIFYIVILLFVLRISNTKGQELNPAQQRYLEEIVERITEQNENSPDLTTLIEDLGTLFRQPLNLNTVSKNELEQLYLLNDFQIASLIDYRNKRGPFLSIYELLYIPGFRQEDIELLQSFVFVEKMTNKNSNNKFKPEDIDHMIILRYQRVLEKQAGYLPVPDSVLSENPDKARLIGSPDKLYALYRLSAGNIIAAGLIAEKDAGEEFLSGSNRRGFDFYSTYITYTNNKAFLRKVIVGDYHIQAGQGLLLWSNYAMGKSSYIDQLPRRSTSVSPNHSVNENRFLRGAAFELGTGNLSFDFFASCKSLDVTLTDSSVAINTFESFRESGNHSTPTEIKNEKSVVQTTFGAGLNYKGNRFKIGLSGYYTSFNKTLIASDILYKSFSFYGKKLTGIAINYLYLGNRFQLFGESAIANRHFSLLNGLQVFLSQNILIGAIHRFYQPSYYSYYANAFSEGSSVNNEEGFFLGGEIRFLSYTFKTYADIFTFPWLKYSIDAPSEGNDFFIELLKKFKKADLYCRYRHREKPGNMDFQSDNVLIGSSYKDQLRINIQYWLFENLRLQNRFEMVQTNNTERRKNYGFLLFQDISLKGKKYPFDLIFRTAYFNTTGYDARIYAYEQDVRFAYTNYMHHGKGWRFMLLTKWQPKSFITFWIRIAQSYYPGKDSIGSGLAEIKKDHKTEIKFQTIIKL